ncbi:MAG: RNA polymerase subunit sigma-70 [Ilumatobacter sp.]|nr:RNA polymerase subunit sigma-70 [Ilumatobacter sp.]
MTLTGPAAARLYDDHVDAIYGYIARRIGPDLAVDVVGDVFEQALKAHERRPAKGTDRGWLMAIATALLRRHGTTECARLETWSTESADALHGATDPLLANPASGRPTATAMAAAAELDPVDRDLLFLTAWEHCSPGEAGEATGLAAAVVRSRLGNIRKELKRLVAHRPADPELDG